MVVAESLRTSASEITDDRRELAKPKLPTSQRVPEEQICYADRTCMTAVGLYAAAIGIFG